MDYVYDATKRLERETITEPGKETRVIEYDYDKVGNRKTKTECTDARPCVSTTYQYDANNRLRKEDDISYDYDDTCLRATHRQNGNLIEKQSAEEQIVYRYDYENHLTRVETSRYGATIVVDYAYDADGNRVKKVINGNIEIRYLVDTNRDYAQVLEERDGDGNLLVRYVYGHDLISQTRGNVTSYYHYDGLGSTRALSSSAGIVTDEYTYDAFGNLLDKSGATVNTHLYTGEFFDSYIGFYYLRARYMNPAIGRFVTMDTFAGRSRDPYSLHKYLYAHTNPVNNIDPSGHMTLTEVTVTGGIIGAMSGIYVYHVTHAPEDRNPLGYVTWGAGGALFGGLLAHGGWYITSYIAASSATGGLLTLQQMQHILRGQYAGADDCVHALNRAIELGFKGSKFQVINDIRVQAHWVFKLKSGWILDPSFVGNLKTYAVEKIRLGLMTQKVVDETVALVGNRSLFSPAEYEELLVVLEAAMRMGNPSF